MRSNLISCYRPVHLNDGRIVNCGHCLACRTNKAKVLSFKGNVEVNDKSNFPLFVLLTYDNDNLPFVYTQQTSCFDGYSSYDVISSDGEYIKNIVVDSASDKLLKRINNIYNGKFPVLYKHDVQCFLKRVRISLQRSQVVKKEMRYFLCGEYGPTNLRPHYHLILLFKSEEARQFVHRRLHSCSSSFRSMQSNSPFWKLGFCNSKLFERGSASYVTSYLVSTLQNFSLHGLVSPCFFLHSQSFGKGDFESNEEFRSYVRSFFTESQFNFEHTFHIFPSVEELQINSFSLLYFTLLPRCREFGSIRNYLFISRLEFASRYNISDASKFARGLISAIDNGKYGFIVSRYFKVFGYKANFTFENMSCDAFRDYLFGFIYRDIRSSIAFARFHAFVNSCCGRYISSYTIVSKLLEAKKRYDLLALQNDYSLFKKLSYEEICVYYRNYYECGFSVAPHLKAGQGVTETRFYKSRRLIDESYLSPKDKSKKIKEKYLLCPLM